MALKGTVTHDTHVHDMDHFSRWKPTKYHFRNGRWQPNPEHVALTSLHTAGQTSSLIIKALEEHAAGDLIDLGCGNAPFAGVYLPLVSSATWVDWGESRHQEIQIDQKVDLNDRLPFADGSFDTAFLSQVLEHIAEPDGLIAETARILRPQGHAIIGVPFLYWLHEKPHDYYRYTRFALGRLALKHSLDVVSITETGGGIDVLQDTIGKVAAKQSRRCGRAACASFRALRRIAPMHDLNAKTMENFPLGYVAIYRKP